MEMVNKLNTNSKVGRIYISLNNSNVLDQEVMETLVRRYENIYYVWIQSTNNSANDWVHLLLQQLVSQSTVIVFGLIFRPVNMCQDEQDLKLLKEYNQLLKQKRYLGMLRYRHCMVNNKCTSTKDIQSLINRVSALQL